MTTFERLTIVAMALILVALVLVPQTRAANGKEPVQIFLVDSNGRSVPAKAGSGGALLTTTTP